MFLRPEVLKSILVNLGISLGINFSIFRFSVSKYEKKGKGSSESHGRNILEIKQLE